MAPSRYPGNSRLARLAIGLLFLTLVSCSNELRFESTEPTSVVASQSSTLVWETKSDFTTTTDAQLDIVWVIDDSGSMADDIDRVKSNFGLFISAMELLSDFKMALITQKQASKNNPNFLDLASLYTSPNVMQVDATVDSYNSLAVTAAALCLDQTGPCGQSKILANSSVLGHLGGFLRPSSKKIFVFATDDNANISADQFIAAFKKTYPDQVPTTFAFVGLGAAASPCQARTGSNYQDLASKTGGFSFNICNTNWTPTFAALTNSVMQLAQNSIHLPTEVVSGKISRIELNGIVIDPSKYTLSGDGIVFDPSILARGILSTVSVYYNP